MRVLVIKCHNCKVELARSKPIKREDELIASLSAPLQNFRCPNGCRATYSDMNANTDDEWIEAEPCV
jgi:lysyl-tRNA synthetase class I